MSIYDYFDKEKKYIIKESDLRNWYDNYFSLNEYSEERKNSERIKYVEEMLHIDDSEEPMRKIVAKTILYTDLIDSIEYLNSNDIIHVDTILISAIIQENLIEGKGFEYVEYVVNEFEMLLLKTVTKMFDFYEKDIYKLFKNRKEYFLGLLNGERYDDFIEEVSLLLTNDYNSDSFTYYSDDSEIVLSDIFEAFEIKKESMSFFKKVIDLSIEYVSSLDDSKYKKLMETDSFEERRKEKEEIRCKKCGKVVPKGSVYCLHCGEKIQAELIEWSKGIPDYSEEDVMTPQDVYEFVMEFLFQKVLKKEYNVVSSSRDRNSIPSFVVKDGEELIFILVEGGVAPNHPKLSHERRKLLVEHAYKFQAKCYYAPISIGACDGERFEKGLALKNDAYYFKYTGLEEIMYL